MGLWAPRLQPIAGDLSKAISRGARSGPPASSERAAPKLSITSRFGFQRLSRCHRPAGQIGLPLFHRHGDANDPPKYWVLVSARVPGPAKTLDDLQRIDRDAEDRRGSKGGVTGADAEHEGDASDGFCGGCGVDPYLRRVKTGLGKKAHCAR